MEKFKSISEHLNTISYCPNQDLLDGIKDLLVNINNYLYLVKSDEAVVTAIKDGFGFCRNQEQSGIYFSMNGLPMDLSEGDILGNYSFFKSISGPQILNPKRIDNIYNRIAAMH